MELVDVLEALEELTFSKEIRKNEWYTKTQKESMETFDKIKGAIKEIENEELKEKLSQLFSKYTDIQGDILSYSGTYAYEKGAMIAQASQHLQGSLGYNK